MLIWDSEKAFLLPLGFSLLPVTNNKGALLIPTNI